MDDAEGTAAGRPSPAVVTFPQEAVFANADAVRRNVVSALLPGVRAVILDLTSTMFCDTSGLRELVVAHRLGHEKGVEMRVVVPSRHMRMITLTGLQGVLAIYPTLAAALAAGSPSALARPPISTGAKGVKPDEDRERAARYASFAAS
jgi:anti-sigma B factor antagonist